VPPFHQKPCKPAASLPDSAIDAPHAAEANEPASAIVSGGWAGRRSLGGKSWRSLIRISGNLTDHSLGPHAGTSWSKEKSRFCLRDFPWL